MFKIIENTSISKRKQIDCLRLKLLQIAKKITILRYYLNIIAINIQELITINYLLKYNIK